MKIKDHKYDVHTVYFIFDVWHNIGFLLARLNCKTGTLFTFMPCMLDKTSAKEYYFFAQEKTDILCKLSH